MSVISKGRPGQRTLLMGNEAIARGALEAGVQVVAGYPGTPSTEIVTQLAQAAKDHNIYAEWSINEKVSLEVAAAASFAGLTSLCAMKQVGVNVAADFLLHLVEYGTRGPMVLVSCEDPGALSSTNEGDSRLYTKMMEFPLLEPAGFQEAKDMTKWAFELSEEIRNLVMLRSVTRMSHASGDVILGEIKENDTQAFFEWRGEFTGQLEGPILTFPSLVDFHRRRQHDKLARAVELFEDSPFNSYTGPDEPELLVITSSACFFYATEAIDMLGLGERVGLLKLGTTWPLPPKLLGRHLKTCKRVMVIEEGTPFLEDNIKALAVELGLAGPERRFLSRRSGEYLPPVNELNPDLVAAALAKALGLPVEDPLADYTALAGELAAASSPARALTFCPGCPHRASFWLIDNVLKLDNRLGFVCGDIGCYTMAAADCGWQALKLSHAMGSGTGLASGFGKLSQFGLEQPALAVCGDSTFFHAVMPALANAIHNRSDMILVVLDNSGTAMTGFQPHPGSPVGARGDELPALDIPAICRAMGAQVEVRDPFELEQTRLTMLDCLNRPGVRVLVLRQACALSPGKKGQKLFEVSVDPERCLAESCGCNRLCTRIFKCPGLSWDPVAGKISIDEVICSGCGVCAEICPAGAIVKVKAA